LGLPESILDVRSREKLALKLQGLRVTKEALLAKKNAANAEFVEKKDAEEYRDTLNNLAAVWGKLPVEKRLKVIELVVEKVSIKELAPHWIGMQITWRRFYARTNLGYVWRGVGTRGSAWTEEEIAELRSLYPTAEKSVVMHTFSSRSWSSIKSAAEQQGIRRSSHFKADVVLPRGLSTEDVVFMDIAGIPFSILTERVQVQWAVSNDETGDLSQVPG